MRTIKLSLIPVPTTMKSTKSKNKRPSEESIDYDAVFTLPGEDASKPHETEQQECESMSHVSKAQKRLTRSSRRLHKAESNFKTVR